jgi:DNA end-binding protein Ku
MARRKARTKQRRSNGKKPGTRPIWKGTINFGLVTIPVALHAAEEANRMDFDLLDRRDLSPIRYRRVSQKSGKEVPWDEVVKGYRYNKGQYVVLTDDDFINANPEATQSIDIIGFVDGADISPMYYDKPYYLEPLKNGKRAYALLREVLAKTGKVGIAKIVIRTRQHLATLLPQGPLLVIDLLRFPQELRDAGGLDVPAGSLKQLDIGEKEVAMAERLVDTMAEKWRPEKYRDDYSDQLLRLIERKAKSGKTKTVEPASPPHAARPGKVIDIMHLLKRSVEEAERGDEPRGRKAG